MPLPEHFVPHHDEALRKPDIHNPGTGPRCHIDRKKLEAVFNKAILEEKDAVVGIALLRVRDAILSALS
jgi:hypothetical protein